MNEKIERALFEARPYVEYFEELKAKIEEISSKASNDKEFKTLVEKEITLAKEPFKTDLRIFLQKFEVL
ncbi:MAG: hypothetical protein J7K57_04045 [Palaeococcus sp.]|uniref:hypothetical protein n=1 Tax=Palaeococcus sp. (in: euryarchaeotes) TaxID=2820298 RepID=UPI0026008E4E|nr:hypothetical protein [Palaeococcus sp. (in: euryarchaeotes)]MCD6559030.1 hypothetical protein [Palaeococcus sp. (in: euryarchaeotes)]